MKNFALAASLALTVCGSAQAGLVEIVSERGPLAIATSSRVVASADAARPVGMGGTGSGGMVVLQARTSDLAEPEMFAMMLVGLVLIGYRATRDSNEKFS